MNAYTIATGLFFMVKDGRDGTLSTSGEDLPERGYYVGGKVESLVFGDVSEVDRGELAWWVGNSPARYYGVWRDVEDGRIYFDAVTHMQHLETALNLAKARKELAVWDILGGNEIRVANDV